MRPIDADALYKEFERAAWYNNADRDEIAEEILWQMPTIDAVPVVRCGECEYRDRTTGICKQISERISISRNKGARMKPDNFCSYGEKEKK